MIFSALFHRCRLTSLGGWCRTAGCSCSSACGVMWEFVAEPLMRVPRAFSSMMSDPYANGTFFRRRMATVRDAFAWPEVREWASPLDRRRVFHHVARQATTILPVIRGAHSRGSFVRAFAEIVREVPASAVHPEPWMRLAYGLLPRPLINALRAKKRKSWAARHAEPSMP